MTFFNKNRPLINTTLRVLIASVGGFILANLVAILISSLLTEHKTDAIVAGMMLSFVVYALVVMFVFSTKTVLRAALSMLCLCLVAYGSIDLLAMVYRP